MLKSLVIIALLFFSATVNAQEIHHEQCNDNATQMEINVCVARNYEIADHTLDSVYTAVLKDISYVHEYGSSDTSRPDTDARMALIESQKTWMKFRDAETELVNTFFEGGSEAGAVARKYRTELTLDRIRELKRLQEIRYGRAVPKPDWTLK